MSVRLFLIAAFAALASGCAAAPTGLPVIKIDEQHLMTQQTNRSEEPTYEIRSRDGFILDASGYKFRSAEGSAQGAPTAIELIVGQRGLYEAAWQAGVERYELTAATLAPKSGSMPFAGFKRGDRLILAIGRQTSPAPPAQPDFYLLWECAIDVR